MDIGPSEAETFWTAFLRKLARRGLRGVKLVISDAHEGIKAAVFKILTPLGSAAASTSCAMSWPTPAGAADASSRFIATAFAQNDAKAAKQQWRCVAGFLLVTPRLLRHVRRVWEGAVCWPLVNSQLLRLGVGRYGESVPLLLISRQLAKKNPASIDGATGY